MLQIIKKWHKLHNNYWLKVCFFKIDNKWHVDIAVARSKRKANDHHHKTKKSPKKLYNKSSNNKGGLEALKIALQDVQEFAKNLPSGSIIQIDGSNEQRIHVYSRLLRYGFIQASHYAPDHWLHKKVYYFLEVRRDIVE